jgi:asparagine synthase (glutamine-hydrolysing)
MCGIAGYISDSVAAVSDAANRTLRDAILYRGRDAQAEWGDERHVRLFHARLSIIDLNTGGQPMWDASGRFVIVFNGEIYNYRELREDYRKIGAKFQTASDTEVILEGFRLKGARVCDDLNGMFAFAIWDTRDKQLFLARDRLGKKPLFWTRLGGVLCFASTLEAFAGMPGWHFTLSPSANLFYNVSGLLPKGRSVYELAFALPPASYAFVSLKKDLPFRTDTYWRPRYHRKSRQKLTELLDEYESILSNAIDIRLRSDVPVALTFSGGVDSGTIASVATRILGRRLECYTVDYHTKDDPSEEALIAAAVAKQLGLSWRYVHYDYHNQLLSELDQSYRFYDQPCHQFAMVFSQRLYDTIKPFATVVLSGNGADELFTGYIGDEKVRLKGIVVELAKYFRPGLNKLPVSPYLRMRLPAAYAASIVQSASASAPNKDVLADFSSEMHALAEEAMECGAENALDLKMFISLGYTGVDSNFRIPDVSGMASQVEVRSPFLDHRMVEFAARLPHRYKVGNVLSSAKNKFLPKVYYQRFVPPDVAWARKKGMGWNLRFDRSIANDPKFLSAFKSMWRSMDDIGVKTENFRAAWEGYLQDRRRGLVFSRHATVMMNGFMLGAWLLQHPQIKSVS